MSNRVGKDEHERGSGRSPLKSEMGNTTVSNAVVSQIAGIAAQEIEKVQMGVAPRLPSWFLQSVPAASPREH